MKRICSALLAVVLIAASCTLFSACFAGAENENALSGERDGIGFCFLEEAGLLLLSGNGELQAGGGILSRPFCERVKYLYAGKNVRFPQTGSLSALKELETVFFEAGQADADLNALPEGVGAVCGFADIENAENQPYGHRVGHCPSVGLDACILCGRAYEFTFDQSTCSLLRDGKKVYDETLVLCGQDVSFDRDGVMIADGFRTVGGEKMFFENNRFAVGTKDIEGVRYTFSSRGFLTGTRALDVFVPAYQILLPILAIPLGACVCFGVYRFYVYRSKKEEEDR